MKASPVVGIVLAAGRSSRTGSPKALAELDGVPFVKLAAQALVEGGCDSVVVVVGPPHEKAVSKAVHEVRSVRNPYPERGMLSSVRVGLAEVLVRHGSARGVAIALVDHPRVTAKTIAALLARWREAAGVTAGGCAVRPVYAGRGGHPVILSREVGESLLLSDASTLREALAGTNLLDLEVDDPGVVDDMDTPGALQALGAVLPALK